MVTKVKFRASTLCPSIYHFYKNKEPFESISVNWWVNICRRVLFAPLDRRSRKETLWFDYYFQSISTWKKNDQKKKKVRPRSSIQPPSIHNLTQHSSKSIKHSHWNFPAFLSEFNLEHRHLDYHLSWININQCSWNQSDHSCNEVWYATELRWNWNKCWFDR